MAGAGNFRDLAVFERKAVGALDAYGNPGGGGWSRIFEARAWLREVPGREAIAAGRIEAATAGTLRVMASPTSPARAIGAADRVQVRGQVWAIKGAPIDPDGAGRVIEFLIERGGAVQ